VGGCSEAAAPQEGRGDAPEMLHLGLRGSGQASTVVAHGQIGVDLCEPVSKQLSGSERESVKNDRFPFNPATMPSVLLILRSLHLRRFVAPDFAACRRLNPSAILE
jgi:hypothetical protein